MNTRVSTRGRIVIPVSMRQKLNIRPDTPIYIEIDEKTKRIILTPITRQYVSGRFFRHSWGAAKAQR